VALVATCPLLRFTAAAEVEGATRRAGEKVETLVMVWVAEEVVVVPALMADLAVRGARVAAG
jgi:hypothetical protein